MSRLIPLAFVLVVGLAASGTAFAHAYLKTAVPPKNGTVRSAPTEVVIDYTEGVEPKPGRETNITYTHLDDAVASAHETEWKQWYKDSFVQ